MLIKMEILLDTEPGFGHMMGYDMFGWGWFGLLAWIVLLALVVFVALYIFYLLLGKSVGQSGETPLNILKKRYAKGEITEKEFEKKKKQIGN